jgi:hypothetical protein
MLPALYVGQIDSEFKGNPNYVGAVPKDYLKSFNPSQYCFGIVNNNTSKQPGSHWVCFYAMPNNPNIIFFDSYGALPNEDLEAFLYKLHKHLPQSKPIKMNKQILQEFGTDSCGWYCIYVLKQLLRGISYEQLEKGFKNRPCDNELMIRQYFNQYHTLNPNSQLPFPKSHKQKQLKGSGLPIMYSRKQKKIVNRFKLRQRRPKLVDSKSKRISNHHIPPSSYQFSHSKQLVPGDNLELLNNHFTGLTNNIIRLPKEHNEGFTPINPLKLKNANLIYRIEPYISTAQA